VREDTISKAMLECVKMCHLRLWMGRCRVGKQVYEGCVTFQVGKARYAYLMSFFGCILRPERAFLQISWLLYSPRATNIIYLPRQLTTFVPATVSHIKTSLYSYLIHLAQLPLPRCHTRPSAASAALQNARRLGAGDGAFPSSPASTRRGGAERRHSLLTVDQ
jgi:hypothetical protein